MGYVCDDDDDYRSILDVSADLILSPEPVIEEAMAFGYHLLTIIYRFYGITSYSPRSTIIIIVLLFCDVSKEILLIFIRGRYSGGLWRLKGVMIILRFNV